MTLEEARAEEAKLSAELTAYCEAHNLPKMCAMELYHEVLAVNGNEPSNFIEAPKDIVRADELLQAAPWLWDFCNRWDAQQEITDALMRKA